MSMKQTKGRKTKGKQKIEMKKIEVYGDRMIAFSKRKGGIFKKMVEIITMCDVEAAFLAFSQAGKPYTFAHPSMEEVAGRLKNPSRQESFAKDDTALLVEAYKKRRIEDLIEKYEALTEELAMEEEKLKVMRDLRKDKNLDKSWWNISEDSLSVEELQQRHQAFVELHDNLCELSVSRLEKDNLDKGGSSYGCAGRGHLGGRA